jgi:hypothetical protein
MEAEVNIKIKDREFEVEFTGDVVTVSNYPLLKRALRRGYRKQLKMAQRQYREQEREQEDDIRRTETVRRSISESGEDEGSGSTEQPIGSIERLRISEPRVVGSDKASEAGEESTSNSGSREEEPVATEQVAALLAGSGHGVRKRKSGRPES